jgi:hypothetical protein
MIFSGFIIYNYYWIYFLWRIHLQCMLHI